MAAFFLRDHPYIWRTTVRHDNATKWRVKSENGRGLIGFGHTHVTNLERARDSQVYDLVNRADDLANRALSLVNRADLVNPSRFSKSCRRFSKLLSI